MFVLNVNNRHGDQFDVDCVEFFERIEDFELKLVTLKMNLIDVNNNSENGEEVQLCNTILNLCIKASRGDLL